MSQPKEEIKNPPTICHIYSIILQNWTYTLSPGVADQNYNDWSAGTLSYLTAVSPSGLAVLLFSGRGLGPEDNALRLLVPVPYIWHRSARGMRCILFVFIWIRTNVRFPWLQAACMLDDQLCWAPGCGVISSASRSLSLHAGLGP